jgi:hypothetical protein
MNSRAKVNLLKADRLKAVGLEHFHNCCGADWLICGRLAIGLVDSALQPKRIANPLQDTILPHDICENALDPAMET